MPNIEHSSLTGTEIHKPYGLDSAYTNQYFVSDGAGDGDWEYIPTGWVYSQDNTAQVVDSSDTLLTINGSTSDIVDYLPPAIRGVSSLWNTSTNLIEPISIGDAYTVRLDLPITAESGVPSDLAITLDIGGDVTVTNAIIERTAVTGQTVPYTISVGFPIFCLSTFKTNGGQFFLRTNAGTVTITNPAIFLARLSSGGN